MKRSLDIAVVAALVIGVLLTFWDALAAMVNQWDVSPMYSYGYTVPPISAFLIWTRRNELRQPATPSRLFGSAVIAIALAMLIVGELGALQVLQQLAFIVAIAGIVLFLLGLKHLRICAPGIAYLMFMVPVWDAITEPLHWPFQNNSARLGVALMQAIDVPVYRDGTFLSLPNLTIEVARECSGINYLVAVLALALPLSFLRLRRTWRRITLIVAALIIAALANGLRVALIGTLAYYEVGSPLHGPFHVLHGLFVAGIGYVVLFVGLHLLQEPDPRRTGEAIAPAPASLSWRRGEALLIAGVFWIAVVIGFAPEAQALSFAESPSSPALLGKWMRDQSRPQVDRTDDPVFLAWGGADHAVRTQYRSLSGRSITVDVMLFAHQRQDHELISYNSSELHRGSTATPVTRADGLTFGTNVVRWPERREVVMFWYDINGTLESNLYATKLRSLWSAIWSRRGNAAAVVLRTTVAGDDAEAVTALQELAREFQPTVGQLWPAGAGGAAGR